MRRWCSIVIGGFVALAARGAERFPPPDFERGYALPSPSTPPWHTWTSDLVDAGVLLVALLLAAYLALGRRSRRGVAWLGVACLAYFGFYRWGCVCSIGAIQNVALAAADRGYVLPVAVTAFFLLPLIVALFWGRAFCAGVCPLGAMQDLVVVRPVRVPGGVARVLGLLPYIYLGLAVFLAATGAAFIICRFDPFVGFFRLNLSVGMLLFGVAVLVLGVFVGRPYCRFMCPYGALLALLSRLSKWRVKVTPKECIRCRLCEEACPFGAIRPPNVDAAPDAAERRTRRRWLIVVVAAALPALAAAGWLGWRLAYPLAQRHPTVRRYEAVLAQRDLPADRVSDEVRAFRKTGGTIDELEAEAETAVRHFRVGASAFGAWLALIVLVKLGDLLVYHRREDYEADPALCVACGRCYRYCPVHRQAAGEVVEEVGDGDPS